jgi:8-oxo-dGTP pyrophosphatase MutT (NUDIX family)
MTQSLPVLTPKICYTAAAHLVHQGKILLVKHKKLQQWLGPGGHIDENELAHEAAEREFLEETGLQVRVVSAFPDLHDQPTGPNDIFHPLPFAVNEHWVCQENYEQRQAAVAAKKTFIPDAKWSKGCEKHFNFTYLVKLVGPLEIKPAAGESKEVRFFTPAEIEGPYRDQLASSIFAEVMRALQLAKTISS